jgi:P-type Ca2+ transporter type 2C
VSVAATQPNLQPLYQESVEAVIAALATNVRRGLSAAEARARLERDGPNELTAEKPVPAWRKFLAQFTAVLVISDACLT